MPHPLSRRALAPTLLVAFAASPLLAQAPVRAHFGQQPGEQFGLDAVRYPDVDGDGHEEYGVLHSGGIRLFRSSDGAPFADVANVTGVCGDLDGDGDAELYRFRVEATSGWTLLEAIDRTTGALVVTHVWGSPGFSFSEPGVIGDVDGDGADDLLFSWRQVWQTSQNINTFVLNGRTGAAIRAHPKFWNFIVWDDINGDGVREYMLATDGTTAGATDRFVDGATGAILRNLPPAAPGWSSMLRFADVDGDGVSELAQPLSNAFQVLSPVTGALLATVNHPPLTGMDGKSVPSGDFNGDGQVEYLFWAPFPGRLGTYNLFGGASVHTFTAHMGIGLALGDTNGNGREELLFGTVQPRDGTGKVVIVEDSFDEEVGARLAFGDGSSGPCPCAAGAADSGCGNSTGRGASVALYGSASLAEDDLTLLGHSFWYDPVTGASRLVVLAGPPLAGAPIPFGAGLLAVGQPRARLPRSDIWLWDITASPFFQSLTAGQTARFQVWYREGQPTASCGLASNLSNAVEVTFLP